MSSGRRRIAEDIRRSNKDLILHSLEILGSHVPWRDGLLFDQWQLRFHLFSRSLFSCITIKRQFSLCFFSSLCIFAKRVVNIIFIVNLMNLKWRAFVQSFWLLLLKLVLLIDSYRRPTFPTPSLPPLHSLQTPSLRSLQIFLTTFVFCEDPTNLRVNITVVRLLQYVLIVINPKGNFLFKVTDRLSFFSH